MKISYNWLKDYLNIEDSPNLIAELLTDIGLEVEVVEIIEDVKGGLNGVVIGKVLERKKHPNADRLSVALVDTGLETPLHIVCGAPNLKKDQKVPVATIGTWLYDGDNKFKIKKSKIRGEVSEGMICGEDELGLGEDTDGIMVLDKDAKIGIPAADYFKLESDTIFHIGLTPNRSDAMSHFGVARDLMTVLNHQGSKLQMCIQNVDAFKKESTKTSISIDIQDTDLCPRYAGVSISGVKVDDSPVWLQKRLKAIGQTPINNIVDITNYVLHDIGQPLHVFDIAKINKKKIIVKTVKQDGKFITLDEVERKLSKEDLMICNSKKPMCIAGVFGGMDSGVSEDTQDVFIESAIFNPVSIRKTVKRHNLSTDASFRFERGVDPNMTIYALKRAALLIKEIAGGKISSEIIDYYPNPIPDCVVELNYNTMDRLVGESIDRRSIKGILKDLEIKILKEDKESLKLSIPPFRIDVIREVDVIEEILRIYGYNNISIPKKIRNSIIETKVIDTEATENIIANLLSNTGFHEVINNSLNEKSYSDLLDSLDSNEIVEIANPLSRDLNVMRQSMLFGLLENISYNQNRQNPDLKLYEFGKTYHKQKDFYKESLHLSLAITGRKSEENWNVSNLNVDFFDMKGVVENILSRLNITSFKEKTISSNCINQGLSYNFKKDTLVYFGLANQELLKLFDIKSEVYIADFNWELISKISRSQEINYRPISKFPTIRRDLSLLVEKKIQFSEIKKIILSLNQNLLKSINLFDVYEGKNISVEKKSYAISLIFSDQEKTLKDNSVDKVVDKLMKKLKQDIGAEVRS